MRYLKHSDPFKIGPSQHQAWERFSAIAVTSPTQATPGYHRVFPGAAVTDNWHVPFYKLWKPFFWYRLLVEPGGPRMSQPKKSANPKVTIIAINGANQ